MASDGEIISTSLRVSIVKFIGFLNARPVPLLLLMSDIQVISESAYEMIINFWIISLWLFWIISKCSSVVSKWSFSHLLSIFMPLMEFQPKESSWMIYIIVRFSSKVHHRDRGASEREISYSTSKRWATNPLLACINIILKLVPNPLNFLALQKDVEASGLGIL